MRVPVHDVRVRQHGRLAAPARRDLPRRARREREHGGGVLDQHPELRVVQLGRRVMRIAQVMDGDHERDARTPQRVRDGAQLLRRLGVEPEVHVEDVERGVMRRDPVRVEHGRRPPSTRHAAPVGGRDVRETDDGVHAVGVAQMPDIDVAGRH